jgi:hypothetical protein
MFPVEFYSHSAEDGPNAYQEIEFLSPYRLMKVGDTIRLRVAWRLLPPQDGILEDPSVAGRLLRPAAP